MNLLINTHLTIGKCSSQSGFADQYTSFQWSSLKELADLYLESVALLMDFLISMHDSTGKCSSLKEFGD